MPGCPFCFTWLASSLLFCCESQGACSRLPFAAADANLVLGRILPDFFPKIFGPLENESLDSEGAR